MHTMKENKAAIAQLPAVPAEEEEQVEEEECPPALQKKTVGLMGLKGQPGLRIEGEKGVPKKGGNIGSRTKQPV